MSNKQRILTILLALTVFLANIIPTHAAGNHNPCDRRLQFRLLEIKALDETNPEWPGDDDIFLGGTYYARHQVEKIPYFQIGDFEDGDVKGYYNEPRVLAENSLCNAPGLLSVTLSLVEEDDGGKNQYLDGLVSAQQKELILAAHNSSGEVASAVGTVSAVVGIATALAKAAEEYGPGFINFLEGKADDFFPPHTEKIHFESSDFLLGGFASNRPGEVILNDHDGSYRIRYDWNITSTGNFNILPVSNTKKCLDVDISNGRAHLNGANVQQWQCLTGQNQQFYMRQIGDAFQIVAVHSHKCVDVDVSQNRWHNNGARVQQWDCLGADQPNQLWRINPIGKSYQLIAAHSGKCMDIHKPDRKKNGGNVQQWQCLGSKQTNQLWQLKRLN